jgi:hypothetical protein
MAIPAIHRRTAGMRLAKATTEKYRHVGLETLAGFLEGLFASSETAE